MPYHPIRTLRLTRICLRHEPSFLTTAHHPTEIEIYVGKVDTVDFL